MKMLTVVFLGLLIGMAPVHAKKPNSEAITYDGPVAKPEPKDPQGGCGSRGGPGYRKGNGQCASWQDVRK